MMHPLNHLSIFCDARFSSQALAAKQAAPVTALFECTPAFPLFHACIETEKLQQIPLWVGEVQRANMQPVVYSRIYLECNVTERSLVQV